jgi:hypothetical protein
MPTLQDRYTLALSRLCWYVCPLLLGYAACQVTLQAKMMTVSYRSLFLLSTLALASKRLEPPIKHMMLFDLIRSPTSKATREPAKV